MTLFNKLSKMFAAGNAHSKYETLYLHIGMGKTGSKWIQKHLGQNKDYLREKGYFYPLAQFEEPEDHKVLTAGTALDFLTNLDIQKEILVDLEDKKCSNLIISSEFVFKYFLFNPTDFFNSIELLVLGKFKKVKILLFIRNTEELILSSYKQLVKEGFKSEDLSFNIGNHEEIVSGLNFFYSKILNLIEWVSLHKSVELEFRNYSTNKLKIKELIDSWLQIDLENYSNLERKDINRSLTAGELFFIEQLNFYSNRKLDLGSDLTLNVANVYKDEEGLEGALVEKIGKGTELLREELNTYLPEMEKLQVQKGFNAVQTQFTFTREQIIELSKLLVHHLNNRT